MDVTMDSLYQAYIHCLRYGCYDDAKKIVKWIEKKQNGRKTGSEFFRKC